MNEDDRLRQRLEQQARRLRKAESERNTLLAQTVFIGTLGLLFVLPVIGGAYLGKWLDSLAAGFSIRWTVSLILLGVFVGAVNVYLFIRER
ncbi:MAG: ATP synthase [Betaproteobacteria bacterium SG8_40]|jgi:ATP synthase protein I|nr:MAG: ATP synthase [Betaproteobacteria bacterium SG8_40]